jgi:branched-chain amino acid transport system substrate-binding protein
LHCIANLKIFTALVVCLLTGCSPVPSTIKIGVAVPLSGPLANRGQDLLRGAQLAVAEINAQGLRIKNSKVQIELISGDDQSSPEQGKQVARALVDQGIVAVIGHLNSGVSMPAAPIYASRHIAQLSMSTHPEYTRMGLPTTFRLVGNDKLESKIMGSYAVDHLKGKVFALVDDGTPFGKNLSERIASELAQRGQKIAVRQSLDNTNTQFASLISELKTYGVDTYITTQADFQVAALAQQLSQAGLDQLQILGADNIKSDTLLHRPPRLRGIYAASPILDAQDFKSAPDFLRKFRATFQNHPIYGAHYTFDAVHVLVAAIKRIESADPKKITAELKTIDALSPVTNNIRFRDDGEQRYPLVAVYKLGRGKWEVMSRSSE